MPTKQADNPTGAFGSGGTINPTAAPGAPGMSYVDIYNSDTVTINANEWVQLDVAGTTGHVFGVKRGVHGATLANRLGIAADTIAAGAVGRVVTYGPAIALAGAAGVTAGNIVGPSAVSTDDGELIANTTAGQVVGIALQTQATGGGTFAMWVIPR